MDHKEECRPKPASRAESAFTLIELVVVIVILGLVYALVFPRLPGVRYWHEEGMLRQLSETITFLHFQAVNDGVYYRLEFDLQGALDECRKTPCYRVLQVVPEGDNAALIEEAAFSATTSGGLVATEMANYLNPPEGEYQNLIPPEHFPSMAQPVLLQPDTFIPRIKTMRGIQTDRDGGESRPYVIFSPRGFSEFAVIQLQLSNEANKATILINPFTGLTDIYRGTEFKDFEWTYGQQQ